MEYLQTTLKYLQEQNGELKQRLKQMNDLNHLITSQRQTEERDYLQQFHQEEIAVIREIADSHEKGLKNEIKKLSQELMELNGTVERNIETIHQLRREGRKLEGENERLREEVVTLQGLIVQGEERQQLSMQQFQLHYGQLEQEYQSREQQVMQKYMGKLQEAADRHEEDMRKQRKFSDFLQNKLNTAEKEKELLGEEVARLIATLTHEEQKITTKNKASTEEAVQLRKENSNLKVYIKNLQLELVELQSLKKQEEMRAGKWQKQCLDLKNKQKELQRSKNKEIERQKSKSKSIAKDLSQQKKFMTGQNQRQKRKEADFNNSKKLLISKIKEIQNKYQHEKSTRSIFDKSTTKTAKKRMETFQSISLDNSFHKEKDSPSVSCFLNPDKQPKQSKPRKSLRIDTSSQANLLRLKDLDTPCFESGKVANVKKTIKIRK